MSLFFRALVDELVTLEEGVIFKLHDDNDTSILTRIFLIGACCDKPAQALLQYLPEPIAAFGCGRCEVRGSNLLSDDREYIRRMNILRFYGSNRE